METLKELFVKIGADTKGLESGKERTKKALIELNTSFQKNQKAIKDVNSDISELQKEQKKYEQAVKKGKEVTAEQTEQYEKNKKEIEKLIQRKSELKAKEQELKAEISQTNKVFAEQVKASEDTEKSTQKLGNALKATIGFITGVTSGVFNLAYSAARYADDVNTLSKQTGIATDEIQKLQYASDLMDVSFETLSGGLTKLKRNMLTAQNGGSIKEYFDQLRVSTQTTNGELRDA